MYTTATSTTPRLLLSLITVVVISTAHVRAAGTVAFQDRIYDIKVVTQKDSSGISKVYGSTELIFFQDNIGQKFLTLPSDANARGDFDVGNHFYYMLNSFTGEIRSYSTIDGTLLKLDGTFFNTTTQTPTTQEAPREIFSRPTIPENVFSDICIVDDQLIGYRTDGITTLDEKVYTITREPTTLKKDEISLPLKNAQLPFLEYDFENDTYLLVQSALDASNTETRDRISAFRRTDKTLAGEIFLDLNTEIPDYLGGASGMTLDPETGVIYLLDGISSKIFVFTPRKPALNAISPASGGAAGGTAVTLTGVNLPANASVLFDGIPATSVIATSTKITAVTPPHALGLVEVTVSGTGISAKSPLHLKFTYVNTLPEVKLTASPLDGLPPLTVFFNISETLDRDGTLDSIILDYGDGSAFVFPTSLAVVDAIHTYSQNGTFSATLTVKDNLGGIGTTSQSIVVGTGGDDVNDGKLVLRALSINILGAEKDSVKIKGEIEIPADTDLEGASLTLGIADYEISPDGLLDAHAKLNLAGTKFSLKRFKKPGFDPNIQAFTLSLKGEDLRAALEAKTGEEPNGLQLGSNENEPLDNYGQLLIFIRITTAPGRNLTYKRVAVVGIKGGKTLRLIRK